MNDSTPNTPTPADLRDRLLDQALREAHGHELPPDLTARILSHTSPSPSARPLQRPGADQKIPHHPPSRRRSWPALAVAASLAVAAGMLLLPATRSPDEQSVADAKVQATRTDHRKLAREKKEVMLQQEGQGQADGLQKLVTPHVIIQEEQQASEFAVAPGPQPPQAPVAGQSPTSATPTAGAVAGAPATNRYGYFSRGGRQTRFVPADRYGVLPETEDTYAGYRIVKVAPRAVPGIIIEKGEEVRLGLNAAPIEGRGAGHAGDRYARIEENPFRAISAANTDHRLSTFSIDVDTASYANVRQLLLGAGTLPPPDAVRIEELINYFQYDYSPPTGDVPFAAHVEVAACPWNAEHRLARIGIKGREMDRSKRPKSNLVFLIDVSGSMDDPAKLPLLVEGMRMLTRELGENDRVSIVVYAGSEGLALPSTPGTDQATILAALDKLSAGGSTAGGAGIELAYKIATENFIKGATNRVILCTDGDFNVGVTNTADLERLAESQAKETGVFLTVLGFGRGNLNDEMMERIADKGNGNYHYVDGRSEARKVLVEEMTGTLVTIAKDVKIQVEFNPAQVAGYRLIGYENRVLAAEDFNDDKKDAGEIGAGHTVTALYEIIPAGQKVEATEVDDLKYETPTPRSGETASAVGSGTSDAAAPSPELLTLKIRYKAPDGDKSTKVEFPITDNGQPFAKASEDFKFASAVASFGMLLRDSQFKGDATYAAVAEIAEAASRDRDPHGYRKEFVEMVGTAKELAGE